MTWTTRPRSEIAGLSVIRAGDGPRLLLLHGVGLRAEAWNAQIAALSGRFEILAPDLPGHGGSPRLQNPERLETYGDRIASLLDRPSVVIGHSMGALIALDLATRFPDRVSGVAALNAIYRRTREAGEAVKQRAAELDGVSPVEPAGPVTRWFGDRITPERQACEDWLRSVDPQGYREAYRVFAGEDGPGDAALAGLQMPALFLTGAEEPNSTPAMSLAMAELAPLGTAKIIDGAAHMMPMTHASEVNSLLLGFAEECAK